MVLGIEGKNISEVDGKEIERVWLKFYDPHVRENVDIPEIPLNGLLEDSAERNPDNILCDFYGKTLTYREVDELSTRIAGYLQNQGVEKQDGVVLMLPNTPHYIIAYYGILKAGGVVVQSSPLYTEREMRHILENSGARTGFFIEFAYPAIKGLVDQGMIERAVICRIEDFLPFPLNHLYRFKKEKVKVENRKEVIYWRDVINYSEKFSEVSINPKEDVAVLQYTGGTTGVPKAVMLTHYNLVANAIQVVEWLPEKSDREVFAGVLPFFHVFGMTTSMNAPIYLSAKIVLFPDPRDIKRIMKAIEKHGITIFCGVPTLFNAVVNHPDVKKYSLGTVRACISGAAPLPVELKRKFEAVTGAKMIEGYGLSETSPVTHANPFNGLNKEGSIGIPFPNTLAVVVDDKGIVLSPGEIGEIAVKGPQVMKGYLGAEEETERVLINGWLLTGDMAKMDEDGYFYIVDRKKDLIIVGGYNVYPREVEEVLYEHPAILEAAVVGVPDEYRGETVKAFVVLKPEYRGRVNEREIIEFCRERIAVYKAPRLVEFREELPKTAVGKILRRALREES